MKLDRPLTFGHFVLDPQDARLFRGGQPVALTPRSFAVLCHLAANAGRLVSKDELLRAVWEDVCVGDGSLKVCVREIRQALGDEALSPRFVETVHRRGYRFIAKPAAAPTSSPQISISPLDALPSDTPELIGRGDELGRLSALFAAETRGERQVADDPLARAHTRGRSAYWNFLWHDWSAEDAAAVAAATEAARTAADRAMLAQHAVRHVHFLCFGARYREACEVAAETAPLALEIGDASEYLLCHFYWAWALLYAGRWGEMLEALDAATDTADRNGHRRWSLLLRLQRAWLHEQALDFEGALRLCNGVVEEAGGLGLGYAESFGLILRGFARLGLRQVPKALRDFERIGSLLDQRPRIFGWAWRLPLHLGLSECRLLQGEFTRARREAERLCALAARPGERTYEARGRRVLAEVALAEGNRKEQETALGEMLAVADGANVPLAAWRVDATAARLSEKLRRPAAAKAARERCNAALRSVAGSLRDGHPLAGTLLDRASPHHGAS